MTAYGIMCHKKGIREYPPLFIFLQNWKKCTSNVPRMTIILDKDFRDIVQAISFFDALKGSTTSKHRHQ